MLSTSSRRELRSRRRRRTSSVRRRCIGYVSRRIGFVVADTPAPSTASGTADAAVRRLSGYRTAFRDRGEESCVLARLYTVNDMLSMAVFAAR